MTTNLLKDTWNDLDSFELRLLLDKRIGGPGQYDGRATNPIKFYLPVARADCRVVLTFRGNKIDAVEPGPAFDAQEWQRISEEIEKSILTGPLKVGRDYSFSGRRVVGSWCGERSGVQILPPPEHAPVAPVEMADHPFILEFSVRATDLWPITNHRRIREHRKFTLLLNLLLAGGTSLLPRQSKHFWAYLFREDGSQEIRWAQEYFFAPYGDPITDELSPPAKVKLEAVEPAEYYSQLGHDGQGLRAPADLDESICLYLQLSPMSRAKFDRALFWLDVASRQWTFSVSSSFASLVSAIESLTERGDSHQFDCPVCSKPTQHEVPGATRRFKDFFDTYAPGADLAKRRDDMYSLRSGILHGGELMQFDQDRAFGWDPPWWNERELHNELWGVTRIAIRSWLRKQPMSGVPSGTSR